MELKILKETKNALFSRKEVELETKAHSTPSNVDVEKALAHKFSIPAENIKIKRILGKFGSNHFNISALIYNSEAEKNKVELKPKAKKKQ